MPWRKLQVRFSHTACPFYHLKCLHDWNVLVTTNSLLFINPGATVQIITINSSTWWGLQIRAENCNKINLKECLVIIWLVLTWQKIFFLQIIVLHLNNKANWCLNFAQSTWELIYNFKEYIQTLHQLMNTLTILLYTHLLDNCIFKKQ